jgi:glutathione S-transferase
MQLFGSTRSPFVRKVLVVAHERNLADRITLVPVVVGVTTVDDAVVALNPLGQIPTLVRDDGQALPDSLLICEYLDTLAVPSGMPVFPSDPAQRLEALSRHAWGQGLMEALVRLFGERKRTGDPLHGDYDQALRHKFRRVTAAFESACTSWPAGRADIGDIAVGCALAYADFRCAEERWRDSHPRLDAWFTAFAGRPAMMATAYVAPAA